MIDKEKLNTEELENVTGGSAGVDGFSTNGKFSGFVNMYSLKTNQEYYFVLPLHAGHYEWFKAMVLNSYEHGLLFTTRIHDLRLTDLGTSSFKYVGQVFEQSGGSVAAYTTKNF